MAQQAVLGQEAGEEHPVPLLIGDLLDQERYSCSNTVIPSFPAELPGAGAQSTPQDPRRLIHPGVRLPLLDRQRPERNAGGGFRLAPRGNHGVLELAALIGR
jgi:hypothetical protein